MTGRSVDEWHGANPDAHVPARVRLRVFERYGGKCWLTGRKIMPGGSVGPRPRSGPLQRRKPFGEQPSPCPS